MSARSGANTSSLNTSALGAPIRTRPGTYSRSVSLTFSMMCAGPLCRDTVVRGSAPLPGLPMSVSPFGDR